LSREIAASFIGVSPSKFDEMVKDGRMPKPKRIDTRRVWSRTAVEKAFGRLPGDEDDQDDEWEAF
jgi:predicted DNA-binding transcriptional regulator AlpA